MALPVYMDVHVPAAITAGLRRRGLRVVTAQEDSRDTCSDEQLLYRAGELDCVFFSQDDDLLRIASQWQREGRNFAGVLYAHQMSAGIGRLISDIELVLTCCPVSEVVNQVKHLPLR